MFGFCNRQVKTHFTEGDILERGVEEIIDKNHLARALRSKKLRVKFGIDPTGPYLHLGHTVPLWKLRQFQEAGHTAVLIIGDFTATIGDPTGRSEERKTLTDNEVRSNVKRYIAQISNILDIKKTEIHYNSEWHKKEGLASVLQLARTATLQQIIKRADFQERIKKGEDITFIELFYPLLQAYDSVKVRADVELGGTDQKFNFLMGRQVQSRFGQPAQDIMLLPLLAGTDGAKKMSKSFNNYIALLDKPSEMFGKLMRISDSQIAIYFDLATPLPTTEIKKIKNMPIRGKSARDLKLRLARTVTELYWGRREAAKAQENFESIFTRGAAPHDAAEFVPEQKEIDVRDLLVKAGLASSKSEAARKIGQGGVSIDGATIKDSHSILRLRGGEIISVGKRKSVKIKL